MPRQDRLHNRLTIDGGVQLLPPQAVRGPNSKDLRNVAQKSRRLEGIGCIRCDPDHEDGQSSQSEDLEMRTTLLVCFLAFLALPGTLQAADPFVGTWKLNVAKSKPIPTPPGMAIKEETQVCQATGERYDLTVKRTLENGSTISIRESFLQAGGPVTYSEGRPPAGTSYAIRGSTAARSTSRRREMEK
jgi:hypothetical protein